jgi:hypothetical protein
MRTLLIALLVFTGCDATIKEGAPTECDNVHACDMTSQKYNLNRFPIQVQASKTFNVDGTDYTLVFYQYGQDASAAYASFVVDGGSNFYEDYYDYPVDFWFTSWDDALFEPDLYYCDDFWEYCDYPGYYLPVFEDEYFIDWVYNTDVWFGPDLIDYYDTWYYRTKAPQQRHPEALAAHSAKSR